MNTRHRAWRPRAIPLLLLIFLAFLPATTLAQQLIWSEEGTLSPSIEDNDNFGREIRIMNVNGDAYDDIVIGAPYYDDHDRPDVSAGTKIGGVYAVLGPFDPSTSIADLLLEGVASYPANVTKEWRVGSAIDDVTSFSSGYSHLVLVTMPTYHNNPDGPLNYTAAGRAGLFEFSQGELVEVTEVHPPTWTTDAQVGFHAVAIEDFNDDQYGDFALGTKIDEVYVYLGDASLPDPATPQIEITGPSGSRFGWGVYTGHVNADDLLDLIVTATHYDDLSCNDCGRLYVFFGDDDPSSTYTEEDADVTITGVANDRLGAAVGAGHDVTGDGVEDLVVLTANTTSKLYVFAGPFTSGDYSASGASVITGLWNVATTGHRPVSTAGDVDGGGVHDILVSLGTVGEAIVVLGGAHLTDSHTLSDLGILAKPIDANVAGGDNFGWTLALGDITNDGRSNLVVGAPETDPQAAADNEPGAVYVYDFVTSVFRDKGADLASGDFDYTGTPNAATTFDYDDSDESQYIFISLADDDEGKLYRTGDIDAQTGLASITDITDVQDGFVATEDLPGTDLRGAAWADVDNDGDADFYVTAPPGTAANNGARLYLLQSGSPAKFEDVADEIYVVGSPSALLKAAVQNGTAASWVDYDRDGQIDLLLTRVDAQGDGLAPVLLRSRLSESGDFQDVSVSAGIELTSDAGIRSWAHAWGDYDGDGDLDLFLADEASQTPGQTRFYENALPSGTGFTERYTSLISTSRLAYTTSATFTDVDGDGYLDIVTGLNWSGSPALVYQNDRTPGSEAFHMRSYTAGCPCNGILPVDYDYDGAMDLVSLPMTSNQTMTAYRVVSEPGAELSVSDYSKAAGLQKSGPLSFLLAEDLAGSNAQRDGDLEIVLGRTVSGTRPTDILIQNLASLADQTLGDFSGVDRDPSNTWIGIILRGGGGNNSAGIGALVECAFTDEIRGEVVQIQVVDGGSLRGSQRSQVLRFGLGNATTADITVTWPDGNVQVRADQAANNIHIVEDDSAPGLREDSESFSYEPLPSGEVNWIFTWETDYASKRELSGIKVKSIHANPGDDCYLAERTLQIGNNGVSYTMTPLYSASALTGYEHTLIWKRDCFPSCSYQFKAFNKTDFSSQEESSAYHGASISVCAQES